MTVSAGEGGAIYYCHHCNAKGVVREERTNGHANGNRNRNSNVAHNEIQIVAPTPIAVNSEKLADRHIAFFSEGRGISARTAEALGVIAGRKWFRRAGAEQDAVGFPFRRDNGPVYAVKWRSIESKDFTCDGAPQDMWGLDEIEKGEDIVIVEGEMDRVALAEIGVKAASVPNGAPAQLSESSDRYKYLWPARDKLESAKRIVIAVDNDKPGEILGEELARRIGKAKCFKATWPEGCKDANDVLLKHGVATLQNCMANAVPWPVDGLYAANDFYESTRDIYRNGIGSGESTGWVNVDELYTIAPGQLTIVTGIPGAGKSEFIDQVMVNLAESKNWRFALCSFENQPEEHIAKLVSKRYRKPFFKGPTERITEEEFNAGFKWVEDHFCFIHQRDGSMSTVDGILQRAKAAVLRQGVRGIVIDPYNYIARERDMTETDWVSDMLTRVRLFAQAHDVHVWFVAHPAKMRSNESGKIPVPGGYDISGSAAWYAKADCGVTVHRAEDPYLSEVHVWKIRFRWIGKQGMTTLCYDPIAGRYFTAIIDEGDKEVFSWGE